MNEQVSITEPAAKPARTFGKKEVVMAWLSVAVGYLYCRTWFVWEKPLYGFLFTILLFAFGFVFVKGKGVGNKRALFYPISALIANVAMFTAGSPFLTFWVFCYNLTAFFMWCRTRNTGAFEKIAGPLYFYEFICGLFSPVLSFPRGFQAIASNRDGKKAGQTVLFLLLGLFIAGIPTAIVYLLLSFDENFTGIVGKILSFVSEEFFNRVAAMMFGILFGMLFYGALFASCEERERLPKKESFEKANSAMKIAPQIVSIVALLPILLLYIIFIIAQKDYYAAVFSGTLPKADTFSSFARDGFFRLCVAAAINAGAVGLVRIFTRKNKKGNIAFSVHAVTVLFSLVTVILAATAVSQMMMYVSAYGLTELRVYALWFMGLIAAFFLVALFAQFIRKLPFAAVSVAVFALFFSVLVLPDMNAVIADYNYHCYQNGAEIDIEYLSELGDSGVPTLVQLTKSEDKEVRERAGDVLTEYLIADRTHMFGGLRLSRILADKALKDFSKDTMIESLKRDMDIFFEKEEGDKKYSIHIYDGTAHIHSEHFKWAGVKEGTYRIENGKIIIEFRNESGKIVKLESSFMIDEKYQLRIDGERVE